ncbi:MAG: hypothetical protein R8G66_17240 [Cytophagales bacterium]|nr:hypothetical protein [Cytophagales bacterium]
MGRLRTKVYILIVCSLLVGHFGGLAQNIQERVYLHPNAQVFVAGETLRFSAFTLSHQTGEVSALSKILYVQLVGEEGPVFEQKLQLEKGRGSGEFFVNSLIPTGRYQLLAYTQWMRNFNDYFQLPVTIINPFETELPEVRKDSLVQISFHHPNNYLITGIETQVGFRIFAPAGTAEIQNGKVIDSEGTIIQKFEPDQQSTGYFNFEPKARELYRVLLEDESGKISFHEFMPVEEGGYDIQVERQTNGFAFIPQAVNRPDEQLTLEVYYANTLWTSQQVFLDEVQALRNDLLPPGLCHWVLTALGKPVHIRTIIPSVEANNKRNYQGLNPIYGVRDSLNLAIDLPAGQYSLSIHQQMPEIDEVTLSAEQSRLYSELSDPLTKRLATPQLSGPSELITALQNFKSPKAIPDSVTRLPEVRDELLAATLQSTNGSAVNNVSVSLSFPGEEPQFKTGFTNAEGKVLFHHLSLHQNQVAYLSVLDHASGWQFVVEDKFMTEFPSFDYSLNGLDSLAAIEIQQRSIDNQLLNAFQEKNVLHAKYSTNLWPQYTQWDFEYAFDDYQRFPDFKEYFVEYIIGAGIKNGGIQIRKEHFGSGFNEQQLVLLDGVPVSPGRILELDPYLVESVRLTMNRVYLGPSVFDGVVLIETYENDLAGYDPIAATELNYQGIAQGSSPFDGPTLRAKQPDRRIHLYWDPLVDWSGGMYPLQSITSDVSGVFEVQVEGFTTAGEPISIRETFQVNH